MKRSNLITLIDEDVHRRAEIARFFLSKQIHIEPFERVSELDSHWPDSGFILIHDSAGNVARLADGLPKTGVWLPIVAYSAAPQANQIVDAVLEGAVEYWAWPFDEAAANAGLARAWERAASFGARRLREAVARNRIKCLSARELQVLAGMAAGLQNRSIADKLGISPRTVEIHRAHMLNKLSVKCATDAIRIALDTSISLDAAQ